MTNEKLRAEVVERPWGWGVRVFRGEVHVRTYPFAVDTYGDDAEAVARRVAAAINGDDPPATGDRSGLAPDHEAVIVGADGLPVPVPDRPDLLMAWYDLLPDGCRYGVDPADVASPLECEPDRPPEVVFVRRVDPPQRTWTLTADELRLLLGTRDGYRLVRTNLAAEVLASRLWAGLEGSK